MPKPSDFTDLTCGDHSIHLSDSGPKSAPAVLLVHGILMDRSVWDPVIDALSRDFRVIALDLRGFGKSTFSTPEISFEDHAADLVEVCEQLQLSRPTLVGWSMGGAVAQVAAAADPARWSRLVLVDATPQLIADADFPAAVAPTAGEELVTLLATDFERGCRAFAALISPESPEVAASLGGIAARTDQGVALAAFASSASRKLQPLAPSITTPTVVICGEADAVCPVGASEFLASAIPGARSPVEIIPGAGHAPFLTRPAQFLSTLSRALRD